MMERTLRASLRETVAEIAVAAANLDAAVTAHTADDGELAAKLFLVADSPEVGAWRYSIMQPKSRYVQPKRIASPTLAERQS